MPFKLIRNDITKMQVDAIVNTANRLPMYSSGTDMAVYRAAGEEALLAERKKIGVLAEGEVAITPGFALPARYILHAVSPFYVGDTEEVEKKLRSCYRKSLHLALELECKSIAFPLIATGNFGYPKEEGLRIALDEINAFLLSHEMMVYLVVFDEKSTGLGRSLYPDLESYIDRNYVEDKTKEEYTEYRLGLETSKEKTYLNKMAHSGNPSLFLNHALEHCLISAARPKEEFREKSVSPSMDYDAFIEESTAALKERLRHRADTFQEYLMYLIETKQLANADVYKRAIITKQLFSKIKLNPEYHPDKATAMRLCVGAELNLDETKDLLARAGYALSPCDKRDIIFSYFIENKVHDMIEIDIALEEHELECFIN